jgi:hypothetical protein
VGVAYLKDEGVVVLLQIEGKAVRVHENLSTSTQYIYGFLDKLSFNPRHIHCLQFLHLGVSHLVQLGEREGRCTISTSADILTLCSICRLFMWFI